jgi:helix-turn-helix protein
VRGRPLSFTVRLSPEERAELQGWQRATTRPGGEVRRGRAILLLDEGHSLKATATLSGMGQRIVRKWARRYLEEGPAGLRDRPGRGGKPVFPPRGGDAYRQGRL